MTAATMPESAFTAPGREAGRVGKRKRCFPPGEVRAAIIERDRHVCCVCGKDIRKAMQDWLYDATQRRGQKPVETYVCDGRVSVQSVVTVCRGCFPLARRCSGDDFRHMRRHAK